MSQPAGRWRWRICGFACRNSRSNSPDGSPGGYGYQPSGIGGGTFWRRRPRSSRSSVQSPRLEPRPRGQTAASIAPASAAPQASPGRARRPAPATPAALQIPPEGSFPLAPHLQRAAKRSRGAGAIPGATFPLPSCAACCLGGSWGGAQDVHELHPGLVAYLFAIRARNRNAESNWLARTVRSRWGRGGDCHLGS
jgi:hypothetical protein